MKICFDLDGTICETRSSKQTYADVCPLPGAVETLQQLKKNGHYIIISTSRHMKTCNYNLGKILAKQGKTLFEWLDFYEIPYDEIWFGKPLADLYVDDKAYKHENWENFRKEIMNEQS